MIGSVIILCIALGYFLLMIGITLGWDNIDVFADESESHRITVVVVFRNEEKNLPNLFASLHAQDVDHARYQLLLVDDSSEDGSFELAQNWAQRCDYDVEVIALGEHDLTGKKSGITCAVNRAKCEHVLVTDADCIMPQSWLRYMARGDADFISGPVQYKTIPNFWQKLLALDFISLIGLGGVLIKWSRPVLANGANMRFSTRCFNEVGGYSQSKDVPSGDDVFLLRSIATLPNSNIEFRKCADAIVETQPPLSPMEFLHQRIRWAGKTTFDTNMLTNPAFLLTVSYVMFVVIWTIPVFVPALWDVALMAFCLKLLGDYTFFLNVLGFMKRKKLLRYLFAIELIHPFYVLIIAVLSKVVPYQWKSRRIKHG